LANSEKLSLQVIQLDVNDDFGGGPDDNFGGGPDDDYLSNMQPAK